jgi:hypothetical protein
LEPASDESWAAASNTHRRSGIKPQRYLRLN